MRRIAAFAVVVAVVGFVGLRTDRDPLAAARYQLVYDNAKRECAGIGLLGPPADLPGVVVWSGGAVVFEVHASRKMPAADRRAFVAGCRVGATTPPPH